MREQRKRLTENEAKARDERLKAMGVTVEHPAGATITTFTATEGLYEFAPERDDDGSGTDE